MGFSRRCLAMIMGRRPGQAQPRRPREEDESSDGNSTPEDSAPPTPSHWIQCRDERHRVRWYNTKTNAWRSDPPESERGAPLQAGIMWPVAPPPVLHPMAPWNGPPMHMVPMAQPQMHVLPIVDTRAEQAKKAKKKKQKQEQQRRKELEGYWETIRKPNGDKFWRHTGTGKIEHTDPLW